MTAAPPAELIDIRTFGSIEEIRALDNFVENNPLSAANYKGVSQNSEKIVR